MIFSDKVIRLLKQSGYGSPHKSANIAALQSELTDYGYEIDHDLQELLASVNNLKVVYPFDEEAGRLERLTLDVLWASKHLAHQDLPASLSGLEMPLCPIGHDSGSGDIILADKLKRLFGFSQATSTVELIGSTVLDGIEEILAGKTRKYRSQPLPPVPPECMTKTSYSERAIRLLQFSGWQLGRSVSIADLERLFGQHEVSLFDAARTFAEEFYGLGIFYTIDGMSGQLDVIDVTFADIFNSVNADFVKTCSQVVNDSLCPIGFYQGIDVLMMNEIGHVFSAGCEFEPVLKIGTSHADAINRILNCTLPKMNSAESRTV